MWHAMRSALFGSFHKLAKEVKLRMTSLEMTDIQRFKQLVTTSAYAIQSVVHFKKHDEDDDDS
jgi:hypothetical protein